MVKVLIGNIFDSSAQTIVNTVNCVGVMGKGIALEFKKRFPEMYMDYVQRCKRNEVKLGYPYLYKNSNTPWILNFPTKDHWRSISRLEDIIKGLEYLIKYYKEWGITSLAVPPLGCGQGQLEWRIVGPTLYRYLSHLDIPVELYAPYGTPHKELSLDFLEPMPDPKWIKPAWVALVEILHRIEQNPYHWPVGRIKFQKIAFIATKEGIPTGLKYQKGSYGPFSNELKSYTTRLVNNGLIIEKRLGKMFTVNVGPTFKDAQKVYLDQLLQWDDIIEKTADLFIRMQTDQAEIAATVIFATEELKEVKKDKPSEVDVLEFVMEWKQRRRPPLDRNQVANTIRNLAALNWLDVKPSKELPMYYEI